jgi:Holliday junction resolvasome RuvABC endonuclease subunit
VSVLALDLGTKTGYAILRGEAITSGTVKLPVHKIASGLRFLYFRRWLIQTIKENDVEQIFFERVFAHCGTEAGHVYGGFMYTLAAVCEELGVKCVGIPVGTIKKRATGKGNASKSEMAEFAKACGFNPIDDNEADALAILFAGVNSLKERHLYRFFLDKVKNGSPSPDTSLASEIFQ